jgi:hypothetical protein
MILIVSHLTMRFSKTYEEGMKSIRLLGIKFGFTLSSFEVQLSNANYIEHHIEGLGGGRRPLG